MITRRKILQIPAVTLALPSMGLLAADPTPDAPALDARPIPSTGELIPAVGMGTSRTFNTEANSTALQNLTAVMRAFSAGQGTVIDSSPMYGQAEERVGDVLRSLTPRPAIFAATKVWTEGKAEGIAQMETSAKRMGVERFDLIAVHNLKDWKTQLQTLKEWKAAGKVRYIGITTSHGRAHDEFLQIMQSEPLDFVQFSYNIQDRFAEQRLFPTARDRGIAVMVNRPFQRGELFSKVKGKPVPEFAREFNCHTWGQFFLKFALSEPGATCVIPASSKVEHMIDNMGANFGRMPTTVERIKMVRAALKSF